MKSLIFTIFFLVYFSLSSYSQNTVKANQEKELQMTVVFENGKGKNSYDIIRLYLTNLSKTDRYKIIMPGDGSEAAWREPYIYFTADIKNKNGKWKQLEKLPSFRSCGNFDAEWQKDTVTINPLQKIQIYEMAYENIIRLFNVSSNGTIRLTAHYDYKQGQHPKEHASEIPKDYKKIIDQGNSEFINSIPSFLLTSDTIEISIKK